MLYIVCWVLDHKVTKLRAFNAVLDGSDALLVVTLLQHACGQIQRPRPADSLHMHCMHISSLATYGVERKGRASGGWVDRIDELQYGVDLERQRAMKARAN